MAFGDSLLSIDVLAVILALAFLSRWILIRQGSSLLPLPPGPRGLPLVGNLFDMPQFKPWYTFAAWAEQYGDIMSVSVAGQPIIILNSLESAEKLLEKQSAISSDRPRLMMAGSLMGWERIVVLSPYGARWRAIRRLLHMMIGTRVAVAEHTFTLETQARRMLRRVLERPDKLYDVIHESAGRNILRFSHGYDLHDDPKPTLKTFHTTMTQFEAAMVPGAFLVDVFPFLSSLPEWFPGTGFLQTGAAWRKNLERSADDPHIFTRANVAAGTAEPSFTSAHLVGKNLSPVEEDNVKWAAAAITTAGVDSTASAIQVFYLAMTLFPDVQAKAKAELDAVVGIDRLPTANDRASLPYLDALVSEVLRWQPAGPFGVPHRATDEGILEGYRIPAGATLIPNVWWMARDPRTFQNPLEFNPDRFLGPTPERDPRDFVFGFGRRRCAGRNLVDMSLWHAFALSLAAFDIKPLPGKPLPVCEMTSSTISAPLPFECSVVPRSPRMAELIAAISLGSEKI